MSQCDLLRRWLTYYDPIHRGFTPAGIANGVCATAGFFFPRVSGGYNLYRGVGSASAIDFNFPVGAAGAEAAEIRNFTWWGHSFETEYYYAVRAVGGGGVESEASHPAMKVPFDDYHYAGLLPNPPSDLRVRPVAAGALEISWTYDRRNEQARPHTWFVYTDHGTGTMDYSWPVQVCGYRLGQVHYSVTDGPYPHGTKVGYVVRTTTAAGAYEGNTNIVHGIADALTPAAHPSVKFECSQET